MNISLIGSVSTAFCLFLTLPVVASASYDAESRPGDLIVRVESGEETFDATKITQGVTNVVKQGEGTLVVNADLSEYTGYITIEQGRYRFTVATALGSTSSTGGRVLVCDGSTLESAVTFGTGYEAGKPYDGGPVGRRIEFSGKGNDGNGALQSSAKNYASPFGTNLVLRGNATWGVYAETSTQLPVFEMNGYALTVEGVGSKCNVYWRSPRYSGLVGSVDMQNVTFYLCTLDSVSVGGDASNIMKIDETATFGTAGYSEDIFWTLDLWGGIYCSSGWNRSANDWKGPIVLHGMRSVSAFNYDSYAFVASGPVSGDGGFNLHGEPLGQPNNIRNNPHLLLKNPLNSFSGGVFGQYGTLHLYDNGALPADGGMLAMTNGTVRLEADKWKDRLEKTGSGTLEYQSFVGSDRLEVKGGKIVLPGGNPAYAGLNYGYSLFKEKFQWSVYYYFLNDHYCFTNETQTSTHLCYQNASKLKTVEWENGWHTNMYVTYTGYLWNRSADAQTWTIAFTCLDKACIYIDGAKTHDADKSSYLYIKNVELSPGPHYFELRIVNNDDPWAGSSAATSLTLEDGTPVPNWADKFGLAFDRQGRRSSNAADYEKFVDPGDGSLLTRALPAETIEVDGHRVGFTPEFKTVAANVGAEIAFSKDVDYIVQNIEGWPTFSKCNLSVTGSWIIGAKDVPGHEMVVEKRLAFGDDSKLIIENPETRIRSATRKFRICTAEGGIFGMPTLQASARWKLSKSDDGKSLWLERTPDGLILSIR